MFKFFNNITRTLTTAIKTGSIQQSIENKIQEKFAPYDLIHCGVKNISWKHNVPKGSETHFEVIVVSNKFDSMKAVDRHKILNELLKEEINKKVSISFTLLEPTRWFNSIKRGLKQDEIYQTPPCLGGRVREFVKTENKTNESKENVQ